MQCRGNSKRHTMANPEDVHNMQSGGPAGGRTRRTGLLTVMERPPGTYTDTLTLLTEHFCGFFFASTRFVYFVMCVCSFFIFCFRMRFLSVISPELVMEVEARMKRNYMPPMMPQRKHSRHSAKPHLPTVQELQGK